MKVAILSLVPGHNYGGIMQSYALQTVLERAGFTVEILSHERPAIPSLGLRRLYIYPYLFLQKYLRGKRIYIAEDKHAYYKDSNLQDFVDSYLHIRLISDFKEISEKDYDAFIVGSDQVWRPKYFKLQFKSDVENAYLYFAKDWQVKRIAYAPSFAVDEWEYTETETQNCRALVKLFDHISVRENSGAALVNRYFDIKASVTLDPTFLLSKDDYLMIAKEAKMHYEHTLLIYSLDENQLLNELANQISNDKKLTPIWLNQCFSYNQDGVAIRQSVQDWLRCFIDSDFVITDSFHACVFSIIFRKPFVVIGNKERGYSRFQSLLSVFGLSDHLICSSSDFRDYLSYTVTEDVSNKYEEMKAKSLNFLKNGLNE